VQFQQYYILQVGTTRSFVQSNIFHNYEYHRLRGSASPVLTATGFVNGRGQFSTPHKIQNGGGRHLEKSQKSRYLRNGLTDLYEIWCAGAKCVP